ncbi:PAS domain-containing protein [Ferrovibrio sp.]|uniref:PAS domain-containing protein n=1 Tax=Ferrovibrio sp. TaxID=1917215 RepID=UPI00311E3B66
MLRELARLQTDMRQPPHISLVEHWLDLFRDGGNTVPSIQDIDPCRLGRHLPDICILDHEGGDDFRFRLTGETVKGLYGGSVKGRLLGDLVEEPTASRLLEMAHAILARPLAILHGLSGMQPAWNYSVALQRISLPLADRYGAIRHIISATVCHTYEGGVVSGEYQHCYAIPALPPAGLVPGAGQTAAA